jgi:hypothetical protein
MAQLLGALAIGAQVVVRPHRLEPGAEGVPFRDIAGVIGRGLGTPLVAKTREEAADHFGWFANFAALDNSSSSTVRSEAWDGVRWSPRSFPISTGRAISKVDESA